MPQRLTGWKKKLNISYPIVETLLICVKEYEKMDIRSLKYNIVPLKRVNL